MVGRGMRSITVDRDGRPVGSVTIDAILSRVHSAGDSDTVEA
jgi:hypothetical protein